YEMLMQMCAYVESYNNQTPMMQSIQKYIEENINRRLTLTEVSAVYGYHPAYFSSRFSKETGVTFSKYVMQRKMSHACHLLETTAWSVDRIAHELSFCDISHFIQRFKAIIGTTPMVYRSQSSSARKKRGE
ncbi:MAG: helix-turn-helix transcriptional regulator, partial [Clostridia bacterium]|nr:helix-turn-helix transcriptional regulator [Clostridia bacterium]